MLFIDESFEIYGSLKFTDYGSCLWIGNLSDKSKIRETLRTIHPEGTDYFISPGIRCSSTKVKSELMKFQYLTVSDCFSSGITCILLTIL